MLDKKNEGKVEKSSDAGRISGAFFLLICSAMIRTVKNFNEQNKEELWQQYVFWIKMEHLL